MFSMTRLPRELWRPSRRRRNSLHATPAGAGATGYRLIVGPLPNSAAATGLCAHFVAARAPLSRGQIRGRADCAAMIVDAAARRHTDWMKLFLPNARATNWLLVIGFCSIGYALYMRYLAVEQSTVGLACQTGLNTWLCFTRQITIVLFTYSVFGWIAVIVAALNLLRPSLVLFGLALAAAGCGVVLYNVGLSSLAVGLLVLSLARRAPEPG
jgi:hypothetical protein